MVRKFNFLKMATSVFIILALIVGCASGGQETQTDEGTDTETNEEATGETTTLNFLAHSNYEDGLKRVIEEFEKENSDIKVNLELAPFSQLMETIEIKMGSKSEDVDLLFVDSPLVVNYSLKGYLEPLDELFAAEAKDNWVEAAVETVTFQDNIMAAPMNNSSIVLYYNKKMLEEKGIPLPAEDERLTWEEVVEMAKKLTDEEQRIYGFSFDRVDTAYQLLALAESRGAQMLSDDGLVSEGYSNSPEAIEAYEFYYNLFNEWKVSPKISQDESIDYFISEKVAMFLGLSHNVPKLVESGLDFGVTLHPYFEDGEVATPTGSWNVGISKYSQNKEAAAKFLEYLTVGDGARIMFEEGGVLPVHQELLNVINEDPEYGEFPNIVTRIAAQESQETAVPRPKSAGYLEWDTNMTRAFENIKNGAEPKVALDEAVKVIDNLLSKYEGF